MFPTGAQTTMPGRTQEAEQARKWWMKAVYPSGGSTINEMRKIAEPALSHRWDGYLEIQPVKGHRQPGATTHSALYPSLHSRRQS